MSSSTRFLPRLHHSLNFPDGIAINYRASSQEEACKGILESLTDEEGKPADWWF
jgi:hypothetical protein